MARVFILNAHNVHLLLYMRKIMHIYMHMQGALMGVVLFYLFYFNHGLNLDLSKWINSTLYFLTYNSNHLGLFHFSP